MKQLILLLISTTLFAQNEMQFQDNLNGKLVADVKDAEIEKLLSRTQEFNDCITESNKFDSKATDNDQRIQKAEDCFKNRLSKGNKSGEELKKLSEKLNLETYGLVKSKNVADITEYLTDKIYKSMTGYSREEKNKQKLVESMKFGNKKMIDQKVFIDMYITQVGKSALMELSRYCFEDFRKEDSTSGSSTTFEDYWTSSFGKFNKNTYTDLGEPKFEVSNLDATDQKKNYESVIKSIAEKQISGTILFDFWNTCSRSIVDLCTEFEKNIAAKNVDPTKTSAGNLLSNQPSRTKGAKSCLVKAKLQEAQKALKNSQLIADQFKKLDTKDLALMLDKGQTAQFYESKAGAENSVDKLTTQTSMDVLEGNTDQSLNEKAEKCKKDPDSEPDCEKFLLKGDSHQKALYDLQIQMNLKKEVERARITEILKNDRKSLEEYLNSNGMQDLAKRIKGMNDQDISDAVANIYEARKQAAVEEFNRKVGKRQVSDADEKADEDIGKKVIQTNAQETSDERGRLAQVVMFNNIIMSSLELTDGNTGATSKNVGGAQSELQGLEGKGVNIKTPFFDNLQSEVKKPGSLTGNIENIGALGLIEGILKNDKDAQKQNQQQQPQGTN